MIKKEDVYKIGRIGKPHGVHGEVQMQYSDDVFDVVDANYLLLNVDGILVPFFIAFSQKVYTFWSKSIYFLAEKYILSCRRLYPFYLIVEMR